MIIVRLQGRLGNQMFQYALAKSLQESGKNVTIDSSMLKYDGNHNELGLFENVKSEYIEADSHLVAKLGDCNKSFPYKVKRKIIGYKKTHILENNYAYNAAIFDMDNVYLEGYWQTEKYFKNIEGQIRTLYTFPTITDKSNLDLEDKIKSCNSVSLHIRRGDYLSDKNAPMHGDICTKAYYDNAIKYIKERVDNPKFYIFTDDAEWARQQYKDEEYTIVDQNHADNSFRDMQLMSLCKHNIIANSSFSWWGAWLNTNKDKIVTAPPKWFNLAETPDVWCEGWKVIGNERLYIKI
jgi:hypothetical protein